MKEINVLFVDDHEPIMLGYLKMLEDYDKHLLNITTAKTIDEAVSIIKKNALGNIFDVAFLDLSIGESEIHNIIDGENLGKKIREISPNTKVAFITMHNDLFRLKQLLKNSDPDGIIIKSDIDSDTFKNAIFEVIETPPYYSHELRGKMRELLTNDFVLDKNDLDILNYLAKGYVSSELYNYIPLGKRTIEKKKRQIKEHFGIEDKTDLLLVLEAKRKGFI